MDQELSPAAPPAQGAPPRLFDRALRRARIARRPLAADGFLHARAAELAAEALMDVARDFARSCIWGGVPGALEALLPAAKLGAVTRPGREADSEASPYDGAGFDLVVSLLDLHAANDPIGALAQARRSLGPDGLFLGVMFGAGTLGELRAVLADAEIETAGGLSPRIFPFADVRDAGSLLQRAGFALPVADATSVTARYADPLRLLADLREAGETNVLTERLKRFTRRDTMARALALYGERFALADGRVPATFSFLVLTGWQPHESQQQPLKPGSATMRLEDGLKAGRT